MVPVNTWSSLGQDSVTLPQSNFLIPKWSRAAGRGLWGRRTALGKFQLEKLVPHTQNTVCRVQPAASILQGC